MKAYRLKRWALSSCVCSLLLIGSCGIEIGDWSQAKHERTVQQQAPLAAGSTLVAETTAGSISVAGADVTDCNVVATISARAPTEEEAQQIAEQVNVKLESVGQTLTVRAEKPHLKNNRSVSVSFKITAPKQTNAECRSSYGSIELSNLDGSAKGKTSSGSINVTDIQGPAELNTSYGSVTCRNVAGQSIKLKSSSGSLTAENIKGAVLLETSYGSVTCKNISDGDIKLKSSSGKITLSKASFGDCDAHTSYGSIVTDELKGDSIRLHSDSGSINVTTASASTIGVSTSYGRINCQQITAGDVTARSGSGNIDIACSQLTPAEIAAEVATSYGSIDFTAPPNFSGQVDLKTSYGSIRTDLAVTLTGEISKKHIQGRIGDGKGRLHLETSSGSITIR
jgi:DUF4097 and DUF4098 domain-containing protein YvlB